MPPIRHAHSLDATTDKTETKRLGCSTSFVAITREESRPSGRLIRSRPDSAYASGRRWRAVLSSGSIGAPRIKTTAHPHLGI